MLTTKKKQTVVSKYQVHGKDTGSPEVQVALLTRRINELAGHLKKHTKDIHSRRGLLQMVADRHAQLKYLKRKSKERYDVVTKKLGLK